MRKTTKLVAAVGASALVVGSAGIAYAYWSTSGSGSGTAATSAGAANLTVTQSSSALALAPGVASEATTGSVTNNALNNAHTTQIVVTVFSVAQGAGVSGACAVDNFGLVAGSTHAILPTTTPQTITLPFVHDMTPGQLIAMPAFELGFLNKAALQDECKSAVPTLTYAVS